MSAHQPMSGHGAPSQSRHCTDCKNSSTFVCHGCCTCTSVSHCTLCYSRFIRKMKRVVAAPPGGRTCLCTPRRRPCVSCVTATNPFPLLQPGVSERCRLLFQCLPFGTAPQSPWLDLVPMHPLLAVQLLLVGDLPRYQGTLLLTCSGRGHVAHGGESVVVCRRLKSDAVTMEGNVSVVATFVVPPWCTKVQVCLSTVASIPLVVPARIALLSVSTSVRMPVAAFNDWMASENTFNLNRFWCLKTREAVSEDGSAVSVRHFYCHHRYRR
jgi:hypothetical protein